MRSVELRPFIRLYENALPASVCRDVIAKFEADPRRYPSHVSEGGYHPGKSCLELLITGREDWKELDAAVCAGVDQSFNAYRQDHPSIEYAIAGALLRDVPYLLQSYRANGRDGFGWHVDNSGRREPTGRYTKSRLLAAVIYLNDVEEGGETEFSVQQLRVKPTEGAILWFPPSFEYPHRGLTPISGPKHSISTFMGYAE